MNNGAPFAARLDNPVANEQKRHNRYSQTAVGNLVTGSGINPQAPPRKNRYSPHRY